ncbi:lactosylceramide 1,3-N-acetyl-beta-D-glucosaminyltransferase-like [Culicoides brevitarsis]|uniref:lactosylceramide 1,3-N-acetyl-beta-D-glucosaminyltransferase-like n=1 Tax=Culicoides brevitarsis TaxID=469753 RepID=UPI00307C90AA
MLIYNANRNNLKSILVDIDIFSVDSMENLTDFKKLINISDFHFIIQQPPCPVDGIDLAVFVESAPDNFLTRHAIRRTWANQTENGKFGRFRVYFTLGTVSTKQKQGELILENYQFQDLIQGSFVDHYRNLTYKHVMSLKWAKYFCGSAKVVLKTNDDVMFNMPFLLSSFKTNFWEKIYDENRDFVYGRLFHENPIGRSSKDRHRVTEEELQGKFYPDYIGGFAIFYAQSTVGKIYEVANNLPFLWIEDAFVSGVAREKTGINATDGGYLTFDMPSKKVQEFVNLNQTDVKNFFVACYNFDIVAEGDAVWKGIQHLNKLLKVS